MDTKTTARTIMVGGTHEGRTSNRDAKVDLGMLYSLLRVHFKCVDVCFVSPLRVFG